MVIRQTEHAERVRDIGAATGGAQVPDRLGRGGAARRGAHARMPSRIEEYRGPARRPEDRRGEWLANGMGWFSVALGLAQVALPGGMARLIGVQDTGRARWIMRAVGARELMAGAGILTRPAPLGWLWARVAGDAMDLALLGAGFRSKKADKSRLMMATAAVAKVLALDLFDALKLGFGARETPGGAMRVAKAITVNRSPEEVYRFWRDFENLPRFMRHLESVRTTGPGRSQWKATAPAGATVEWDAEVTEDRPNEAISWRSLPGASVENRGTVRFRPAPGGRGTEVRVEFEYAPPGGALGAAVAKLFGEEPDQQVAGDLKRFKQVMETGEVAQSDASRHATPHPAQPS
jgi:uncharacterized membrane protein